jgi:TonB family protein
MTALLYQSRYKWRFGAALGAAIAIHFTAIGFANGRRIQPPLPLGTSDFPEITFIEPLTPPDPPADDIEPLPTPPVIDPRFTEQTSTPAPRRQITKVTPIAKPDSKAAPRSLNLSSARVLALNAPRPEYPYEARRQKLTGDGIAMMTIDPASGNVTQVTMAKSTGSPFLDNAALAGFKRWRFKPGTVSSVTCPVTFTLTGASY